MWEDPIVAEVHRTREMLAAKFNFDIEAYFAVMQKRQAALGDRLVSPRRQADPTAEADQGRQSASPGSMSSEAAPAAYPYRWPARQ